MFLLNKLRDRLRFTVQCTCLTGGVPQMLPCWLAAGVTEQSLLAVLNNRKRQQSVRTTIRSLTDGSSL